MGLYYCAICESFGLAPVCVLSTNYIHERSETNNCNPHVGNNDRCIHAAGNNNLHNGLDRIHGCDSRTQNAAPESITLP
jgi:hypothetical protein